MNFEDVEAARKKCQFKDQALAKKRKKAILISCLVVFSIEALILLIVRPIKFSEPNFTKIILSLIFVFVACALQLGFIGIIVFILTYKDTTVRTECYLAYKKAYKSYFIYQQLNKIFTDLQYNHEQGLDKNLLKESGIIYTGDIYKSNDLVKAKYKNVKFLQADVEIIDEDRKKDEDGKTEIEYDTVFKGRYLIFDFPKKFDFKMAISFHGYGGFYINPKTGRGLNMIKTESPEFNKRFLVYAEDGFEAFYILDPIFLDKLEKLGAKYDNNLALYFSDSKLYIGLNDGGDSFEPPSPDAPINEQAEKAKVINDMKLITDLVDNLKLSK